LAVGGLRGEIRLREISTLCSALAVVVAALAFPLSAFATTATLALIAGADGYVPATRVRLRHADILPTASEALTRCATRSRFPGAQGCRTRFRTESISCMHLHPEWNVVLGR
jgi:hypothetical protein